jgi:hypothetical protein
MTITGTVKNNGNLSATNSQVIATYYSKTTGNVFWASKGLTDANLKSLNFTQGLTTRFEILSQPQTINPDQISIALVAESGEYISEPFTNLTQDLIKPQIGKPTWSSATSGLIVGVNVSITKPDYASKLDEKRVTLHFKASGGQWQTKNMSGFEGTRPGFKDLWTTTIPAFGSGQTVQFYIEAFDLAGNEQSRDSGYTVQGQPSSGVPPEALLIALIVLILLVVIIKYRKKLF